MLELDANGCLSLEICKTAKKLDDISQEYNQRRSGGGERGNLTLTTGKLNLSKGPRMMKGRGNNEKKCVFTRHSSRFLCSSKTGNQTAIPPLIT